MYGPALALLVAAGLAGAHAPAPGIRAFAVPSRAAVGDIVAGPDDALWFVTGGVRQGIGRIAPDGRVSLFGVPGARLIEPEIAVGPDGTLVFATDTGIDRMTTSGQVTSVTTPIPPFPDDFSVTAGPDGSFWMTYGPVVRLDPDGGFSYPPWYGNAVAITAAPDGSMWYLESDDGDHPGVVRIAPDGSERRFPAPGFDLRGGRIAAAPDGAMWFVGASRTLSARNLIGRLAPSGRLHVFRVRGRRAGIDDVAPGPDGAMWFTDERGFIGRISKRGRIAEFPVPRRVSQPYRITAGPDGAMWFTAGDIGRVSL